MTNNSRTILSESVWQALNEDTRSYLTEWDSLIPLFEADLSLQQIQQLFQNAEKYAVGSGGFQTAAGKVGAAAGSALTGGVKLAGSTISQINAKVNELGKAIQDTTPVQGINSAFEKAKRNLFVKLGSKDTKVDRLINKMRQLAKNHPGKTKFLVGALTTAAALAAGPAGIDAASVLLRLSSNLLGNKNLPTAASESASVETVEALAVIRMKHISGIPLTESEQKVLSERPIDAIKRVGKELGQKITYRKLAQMWNRAGKPTDSARVLKLLIDSGLDNQAILDVANVSGVEIPTRGTRPAASAHLQRPGMVSRIGKAISGAVGAAAGSRTSLDRAATQQQRGQAALSGSTQSAGAQPTRRTAQPAANPQAAQNVNNYVRNVASQINQAQGPQKIALAKEIVNFMADRKGSPEWENAAGTVKQVLKKAGLTPAVANAAVQKLAAGQTMESFQYWFIKNLLNETNLTFADLGLVESVRKINNQKVYIVG